MSVETQLAIIEQHKKNADAQASDHEPVAITEKNVMAYRKKLLDYVKKEQPDGSEFGYKTYLLDMLYFMGLAIDEKRFYAAEGFEEFKRLLKQEL
jgi:hypothetical protein